jgi:hypothetical protein
MSYSSLRSLINVTSGTSNKYKILSESSGCHGGEYEDFAPFSTASIVRTAVKEVRTSET